MFQTFFTDTLMSKFIKGLLSTTNIPLLSFVNDGDYLYAGQTYIYNHLIIQCMSAGNLKIDNKGALYPSEDLYPNEGLFPGKGNIPARFKVLAHYNNEDSSKYNYKYKSNISYYDSETHKHLGNYLRFLRDSQGLNLLPYYNCYNYQSIDNFSLYRKDNLIMYKQESMPQYKEIMIPIKFNTSYTIAIECPTDVLMRAIIYGPTGLTRRTTSSEYFFTDELNESGHFYANLQFDNPVLYSITNPSLDTLKREKYLYLVIQLPVQNNSSIAVLEGDYTMTKLKNIYAQEAENRSVYGNNYIPSKKIQPVLGDYSLLTLNTRESYAFSDRLVEYLLGNVINKTEVLSGNIAKVQTTLAQLDNSFKSALNNKISTLGVWDDLISSHTIDLLNKYNKEIISTDSKQLRTTGIYMRDMDGNINKDVEEFFTKQGGYK